MSDQVRRQVRLLITGRVQGVCYRATACDQALELGLRGWVRNRSDGSVEALAIGTPENVDAFISWCWQGPRAAKVEQVQVEPVQSGENLWSFEIRY